MNIIPLVIQPQTFTTDPPRSMQAKFNMKIITSLQNLKKPCFIHCTKQKPFFINTSLFLYLNSKNLIICFDPTSVPG